MGEPPQGVSTGASLPALPRRVGRRVLLKLAARGGMGDVYLAATTGIEGAERPCIVKTVRRDHIHDASFIARFLDEARVQAQLHHPGIAQVLEAATDDDGEPYTVVDYVEGRSLGEVRQRAIQTGTRITWAEAVAAAIEVAQALAHVHERSEPDGTPLGIVHRDLSPQNVMVGYGGEVKVIDFGTARGQNRRSRTVAGVVFAKPGYVAPEVARQQVGDGRIDLYALGIILWELCAGRRFLTTDPQRHLDEVAAGTVVLPAIAHACGAPPELDQVIAKLTKNDPDERYGCAGLAVPDLAALLVHAAAAPGGERGLRARLSAMMRGLWPHEPARGRAEFARLLLDAKALLREEPRTSGNVPTGPAPGAVETRPAGPPGADPADAAALARPSSGALAGTPYRLMRVIGEGASGAVWEAEHVELGRRVALKVLAPEHASSPASRDRFRREARALAALCHPNLVQTLDYGRSHDGRPFLAMELLVGETLETKLRGGPLRPKEATRIALEACDALAAAHAAGIVHRDIKPDNLMLTTSGHVKLIDFGVALALADGSGAEDRVLRGFAIFGTPEYMAPEQVTGEAIDPRTDLYALGCVLYEMLTGAPPFDGSSSVVVMGKQLRDEPRPLRDRARERDGACVIPAALEAVVVRAMTKDRRRRFASAAAMHSALSDTLAAPQRQRTRVRRVATATLMAACMIAAAGLSAHWTRSHMASIDASSRAPSLAPAPETSQLPNAEPPSRPVPLAAAPSENVAPATTIARGSTPFHTLEALAPSSPRDPHAITKPHPDAPEGNRAERAERNRQWPARAAKR